MQKAKAFLIFFLCFLVLASMGLYAQEEQEESKEDMPYDSDWDGPIPALYSSGDKCFTISMGMVVPTLFIEQGEAIKSNLQPVGGTLCLSFTNFLGSHFFLGGELSGLFNTTLAKNTLYIVPIGLITGWQFIIWKFEIPVQLAIGIAPTSFRSQNYFGMYMKAGASLFYRFSPDWSFGLNTRWSWYPQWTKDPKENVDGNFIDITLSARYHF